MIVAAIRPDDWNLPLLVHVVGATVLVGALVTTSAILLLARRAASPLAGLGFRTLLLGALPGWVVMRAGGQWIDSRQEPPDDAAWIGIGYVTADVGLLLLVAATAVAGLAARRVGRAATRPGRLAAAAAVLSLVLLSAYAVAVWAMTTKPA